MKWKSEKDLNIAISISILVLLLVLLTPLISKPFFTQNDDWVYYLNITNFISGNYILNSLTAPIFYTQGIIAALFASLFGFESLYYLTIIVSLITFMILAITLTKIIRIPYWSSILVSSLLLFNPIFVYSMLGFMTDNYFLLILVLTIFFIFKYQTSTRNKKIYLYTVIILQILGFFLRQVNIVFMFATLVWFIIYRKKDAIVAQTISVIFLLITYYTIFPRTNEMYEKTIALANIFNYEWTSLTIFSLLVYTSLFVSPLIFGSTLNKIESRRTFLLSSIIAILLTGALITIIFISKPEFSITEFFPYLDNTFTRKGFFTNGLSGNKYHFKGYFDLFNILSIVGVVSFVGLVSLLIFDLIKKKLDPIRIYVILMATAYISILILSPRVYDRYVLPLIPLAIIYFALDIKKLLGIKNILFNITCTLFIILFFGISYIFLTDYISWNSFVWKRTNELVNSGVTKSSIKNTHSYNREHGLNDDDWKYLFTFDNHSDLNNQYELVEEHKLRNSTRIFIDPTVYVYYRENNSEE